MPICLFPEKAGPFSSGFILDSGIESKTVVKFGYNEMKDLIAFDFTTEYLI
ncbi:hypothetical protein D1BOALGB6SA_6897 [Olavius sp. associated proteobacterium Delta 1]|nr:hypothetical protein D1BOALGB6SA_6897 [Olavius sp. associated proteobacterium Delta 1]